MTTGVRWSSRPNARAIDSVKSLRSSTRPWTTSSSSRPSHESRPSVTVAATQATVISATAASPSQAAAVDRTGQRRLVARGAPDDVVTPREASPRRRRRAGRHHGVTHEGETVARSTWPAVRARPGTVAVSRADLVQGVDHLEEVAAIVEVDEDDVGLLAAGLRALARLARATCSAAFARRGHCRAGRRGRHPVVEQEQRAGRARAVGRARHRLDRVEARTSVSCSRPPAP